jgi:predicted MPP superfamily phosphohydrolase
MNIKGMALSSLQTKQTSSRRNFLKAGLFGAAGLAFYSGEVERHWIDVAHHDVELRGLPADLHGLRIVQISDIHMDDYTEPFFLRRVIERVNQLKPDAVFLTGDFVTSGKPPNHFAQEAAWKCAGMLKGLECRSLYAALGNHDISSGSAAIESALRGCGITVIKNSYLPIERGSGRLWLAGLDDPLVGHPNLDEAIPERIRGVRNEPLVLLCHAPDYATKVLQHPGGQAVDLMISGHTHGGQIRLPLIGAVVLPPMGRRFIEGWFQLDRMRLYVNRGIGTIGLPFRLDCPPEITVFNLRAAA